MASTTSLWAHKKGVEWWMNTGKTYPSFLWSGVVITIWWNILQNTKCISLHDCIWHAMWLLMRGNFVNIENLPVFVYSLNKDAFIAVFIFITFITSVSFFTNYVLKINKFLQKKNSNCQSLDHDCRCICIKWM